MDNGTTRIVACFPRLGIAIKFARIRFRQGFGLLIDDFLGRENPLRREWHFLVDHRGSIGSLLFKGIRDNWKEFCFYLQTRHPLLQPTYFSFFGLLNIQRVSLPCDIDLFVQFYEIIGEAVFEDKHHFSNSRNFARWKDGIRIFDYGSPQTQRIIREFGTRILQNFNPHYDVVAGRVKVAAKFIKPKG